jgi:hypothetical protein
MWDALPLCLPRWTLARLVRIAVYGALMAGVIETARTTPYLGLPLEPKPRFIDCYQQAAWNGKVFVETGRMICLGDR